MKISIYHKIATFLTPAFRDNEAFLTDEDINEVKLAIKSELIEEPNEQLSSFKSKPPPTYKSSSLDFFENLIKVPDAIVSEDDLVKLYSFHKTDISDFDDHLNL